MSKIKTVVVGASGYIGGEAVRLLLGHPNIDLVAVTGHESAGRRLDEIQPNLRGYSDLVYQKEIPDAEAYVAWLTKSTGHEYRLLHEAEWEYAARAGTAESRWGGDDPAALCRFANGADLSYDKARPGEPNTNKTCDDGYVFTNPVNAMPANPWGLHDMLGNLWQWTADCFTPKYSAGPSVATVAIAGGDCTQRVVRGGSWHNYPDALRSAARFALPNTLRSSSIGFRVLRQSGTMRP